MSATDERNEHVRRILDFLYDRAIDTDIEIDESAYKDSLEKLFSTTAWGFREICCTRHFQRRRKRIKGFMFRLNVMPKF